MRILTIAMSGLLISAGIAQARDVELHPAIAEVLSDAEFQQKVGDTVAFYFGDQPTPAIARTFGDYVTNKKTNSFGKPDVVACRWAMLSALLQLRERAAELGADGVINVTSYYKKATAPSRTEYECHAGNVVAGVALKGTFVKFGNGPAAVTPAATTGAKASSTPASTGDAAARLKQLDDLKKRGLITQREYEQRRKTIIEGL